jgi:hypothetical protein
MREDARPKTSSFAAASVLAAGVGLLPLCARSGNSRVVAGVSGLAASSPPVRLGTATAPLRFAECEHPPGSWRGRRYLTVIGIRVGPVYAVSHDRVISSADDSREGSALEPGADRVGRAQIGTT